MPTNEDDRRRAAGEWYDAVTQGRGSPEGREAHIRTSLSLRYSAGHAEERKARTHPSQAKYDSQPERKRVARYRREIHQVKQLAAAPLRPSRIADPKPADPAEPMLFEEIAL